MNGPGNYDNEEIMALSILGYILTYSVLLRKNFCQRWVFNRGDLNISASAMPNNKDTFKTKRNGKLQHIQTCSNNKTIDGNGLFCHNK